LAQESIYLAGIAQCLTPCIKLFIKPNTIFILVIWFQLPFKELKGCIWTHWDGRSS